MSAPNPGPGLANKDLIGLLKSVKCRGLSSAGVVIGTSSAAQVKWGSSIVASINGKIVTVTTNEVAFTATTHDIAASATVVREAVYAVEVDSAGTVTLNMGEIASGSGSAVWPAASTDKAVIGGVRVAVAAGATSFDASTDLLSATHITDTYYNVTCSPIDLGETLAA